MLGYYVMLAALLVALVVLWIESLIRKIRTLEAALGDTEEHLETATANYQRVFDELEECRGKASVYSKLFNDSQDNVEYLESQVAHLTAENQELTRKFNAIESDLRARSEKFLRAKAELLKRNPALQTSSYKVTATFNVADLDLAGMSPDTRSSIARLVGELVEQQVQGIVFAGLDLVGVNPTD